MSLPRDAMVSILYGFTYIFYPIELVIYLEELIIYTIQPRWLCRHTCILSYRTGIPLPTLSNLDRLRDIFYLKELIFYLIELITYTN